VGDFAGRVAVVAGAGGGIGAAIVDALGRAGACVAAVDTDEAALRALAAKTGAAGLQVAPFPTDISRPAAVEATVKAVETRLGPIHYLVNAAGIIRMGPLIAASDEDWLATFATNTNGVFFLSRTVARGMADRGGGAVVTVASNAAGVPRMRMGAYSASKAAATAFTKTLGLELAAYGVRCNVVAPGSTDTSMLRATWRDEKDKAASLSGSLDDYRVGIPLGKLARPSDIADAVLFLLSDRASHITMHELCVDGGAALGR
jgi:2,3-dihydro-2,3-dihydroxybenzoate dehydrogenase